MHGLPDFPVDLNLADEFLDSAHIGNVTKSTYILLPCGCVNINGVVLSPTARTACTRNKLTKMIRF